MKTVSNLRDFPTLVKHMNVASADSGRVRSVLASVADTGDLLVHRADESGTFDALNPVGFRVGRLLI